MLCISGDVLGPVFSRVSPKPFSVYSMWGFVYNGVEQHAFDVAFNVLMLKYLRVSNQLDAHVQRTILTDVNKCEAILRARMQNLWLVDCYLMADV